MQENDYELIFTAPKQKSNKLKNIASKYRYRITQVGKITSRIGIYVDDQKILKLKTPYQHFF